MADFAENAMSCLCFGRATHNSELVSGAGHSESFEPVDALNSLVFPEIATGISMHSKHCLEEGHNTTLVLVGA